MVPVTGITIIDITTIDTGRLLGGTASSPALPKRSAGFFLLELMTARLKLTP